MGPNSRQAPCTGNRRYSALLHKVTHIIKVIATVSTPTLFGIGTGQNNRDSQVICRVFVIGVRAGNKSSRQCNTLINQDVNFAARLP